MARLVAVAFPHADPMGTPLGMLTDAISRSATVEMDGVGSGSVTINGNSAQAPWTAPGNYVALWRDAVSGPPIAGFWVAEGGDTVLSPAGEGGEAWTRAGPGPIKCLDEAIVWHRLRLGGGLVTVQRRKGRWVFRRANRSRWDLAQVLVRMVREAKARGCIPFVTMSFTSSTDSDGVPWPSDLRLRRYAVPIGTTLTELVTMLRAKGLRIEMDARFRLHCWPEDRVNDLSGTISIVAGTDVRDQVERDGRAGRTRSNVLVGGERHRGGERYVAVNRPDIRAELGRREEGFRDTGKTKTRSALRRTGRRALRQWRQLKDGPASVPVLDAPGQVALVDYRPGDTVTLTVPGAWSGGQRIVAVSLLETSAGEYDPVLEFGGLSPDQWSGEDFSDDAATAVRS